MQVSSEAIYKTFHLLVEEGSFRPRKTLLPSEIDASAILYNWLSGIFDKFYKISVDYLASSEYKSIGFSCLMQLIRLTGVSATEDYAFPVDILTELIELIASASDSELFGLFDEAVNSHRDIRFYTLRVITHISQKYHETAPSVKTQMALKNLFKILSEVVMETDEEIQSGDAEANPFFVEAKLPSAVSSTKGHLQEFSSCWLMFLQNISIHAPELHRSFLMIVNERVIPYMPKPALLADYLTDSYNAGGLVSLLALNGLFTLIHKHNLDYPAFFPKLYTLLDRNIFHCRYRKRFCKLFGVFMTSTHMPAYLVAAFVKRVARLSLDVSPTVIIWVIPFIYNMFKAHPAIRVLIHRQVIDGKESSLSDPFLMEESDPAKCKAIQSSIWEIHALSRHYWTGAVKQSKLFSERLTKQPFDLNQFLEGPTHNSLIQEELSHKWTKVPPLNITIPTNIF